MTLEKKVEGFCRGLWQVHSSSVDISRDEEVLRITSFIKDLIEEERKRLRTILGFDVVTKEEEGGHRFNVCHDPYYDLEGAVIDLEREGADKACVRTIKRHQAKLIAFDKATKAAEGDG